MSKVASLGADHEGVIHLRKAANMVTDGDEGTTVEGADKVSPMYNHLAGYH